MAGKCATAGIGTRLSKRVKIIMFCVCAQQIVFVVIVNDFEQVWLGNLPLRALDNVRKKT